jgi:hypothetical protein
VAAEHAGICNIPGAELGRDPTSITRSITRSIVVPVSHDRPATTRAVVEAATDAGSGHIGRGLAPCPAGVARWVADEVVTPSLGG